MNYFEKDGQVILSLSREDYDELLNLARDGVFKGAQSVRFGREAYVKKKFEFLDRLNSGNPHYTPYRAGEKER